MSLHKVTINQLIKKLQKIEKKVPRGTPVVVNLAEYREIGDQYSHWNIFDVKHEMVPYCNEGDEGEYTERMVVSIL